MNDNLTEIVVTLDKSGSMEGLTNDTIGGYNSFINEQKTLPGEALLTTVFFSDKYNLVHDRVNIQKVMPVTTKDYKAEGTTALLDAMGKTIDRIGLCLYNTSENERPGRVIFFVITDGEENASREYTHEKIKGMVELQKNIYSWDFVLLGANINSISTGARIGISAQNSVDFDANDIGMGHALMAMDKAVKYKRTAAVNAPINFSKIFNSAD